jgi:regulator of sigma E protease
MSLIITALWFLVVLTPVVCIHELGHFFFGRLFGVDVEVFSIGFGKPLVKWRDKKNTLWQICIIPLGGYVKMLNNENAPASKNCRDIFKTQKTFNEKTLWKRALIVFGGPLANYILTVTILSLIYVFNGIPSYDTVISKIKIDSPSYNLGLRVGDRVTDVNSVKVSNYHQLAFEMSLIKENPVLLGVVRSGLHKVIEIKADFTRTENISGQTVKTAITGLHYKQSTSQRLNILESLHIASKQTLLYTSVVLKTLASSLTDKQKPNLAGPILMAKMSKHFGEKKGWIPILQFVALVSLNIGLMNLLPIPTLDGGYLLFYLIEVINGSPMKERSQNFLLGTGFIILILLSFTAFWNDFKLIRGG